MLISRVSGVLALGTRIRAKLFPIVLRDTVERGNGRIRKELPRFPRDWAQFRRLKGRPIEKKCSEQPDAPPGTPRNTPGKHPKHLGEHPLKRPNGTPLMQ